MIRFKQGNLLETRADALVNTVNTVGVMGKGIALMFKERFPENFKEYAAACKAGKVEVGRMLVTPGVELDGPRWIINFPTKQHWRQPTQLEWVESGLDALKDVIREKNIRSIALPPLGCGNGGLDWSEVRPLMESSLAELEDVEIIIFEPSAAYQNISKKKGVEDLTPAKALIVEIIWRYGLLGIECTLLEVQKLAWLLERSIKRSGLDDPLDLRFEANRYGPYANRLDHLLNSLDGSYLHCEKRISDANPFDTLQVESAKREKVTLYLNSRSVRDYLSPLEATDALIDGFQSPLGMEVLATVDWLLFKEGCEPTLPGIKKGIEHWPAGKSAAERKKNLFTDQYIELALDRLLSITP